MNLRFRPQLLDCLPGYTRALFLHDLLAGISVGIIALPLSMAFAIASGLKPEQGLYTAIIAGFCISAFGGTRFSIGGPAGAFIVVIYGIVEQYGAANLLICTVMAGAMMFLMGVLRLGAIVKFVPEPVVTRRRFLPESCFWACKCRVCRRSFFHCSRRWQPTWARSTYWRSV